MSSPSFPTYAVMARSVESVGTVSRVATCCSSRWSFSEVKIVLFQENPVLDYYFVEVVGQPDKGWIPDHFLSFDPVV